MLRDKPLHNFLFETDDSGFYDNLDTWCTPWIDTCCLLHLIRKSKPQTFLEVGTHRGYTTRIIAHRFPNVEIVTVDPGDKVPVSERPDNQKDEFLPQDKIGELVNCLPNVTIIKEAFSDIDWGGSKFGVIFLDGNHSYEHVLSDSRLAIRLLDSRGILVWHDYGNVPDVGKALAELTTVHDIVAIHNTWIAYLMTS
jgi:predicted O-methyltransferase YrrM